MTTGQRCTEVSDALGIQQEDFAGRHKSVLERMVIAQANDGRLTVHPSPELMTKKDEVVHFETTAALMKEVTLREWRGRGSGVSFKIAKGVRYRTGAMRGHSVVIGTELQVADTGVLSITSQRAAFIGQRKTVEMAYAKLMNVELFSDGIRFSVSNRQNASLFKITANPEVFVAVLNAAVQRLNA